MSDLERAQQAARSLWVALNGLSEQVEMAEATGICLPDRIPALVARDTLAEYNEVVLVPPVLEETLDGGLRQVPSGHMSFREGKWRQEG